MSETNHGILYIVCVNPDNISTSIFKLTNGTRFHKILLEFQKPFKNKQVLTNLHAS